MIAQAVADRVKRQFGDESGVQVTDADIIRWINDGQRDIARTNNLLQARGTLNIVAGTATYPFPSDVLNLWSLKYDGKKLKGMSLLEFDEYIAAHDPQALAENEPYAYTIWNQEIQLYPTPVADLTNGLSILYIARPSDVTVLGDTLALPDEYFNRLVEYVLQQAYELDEDWNAAAAKAQQLSSGLALLSETETWTKRETYPTITVLDEDL